jgi:hypothetical protein
MLSALPQGLIWASAFVAVVALVVGAWLLEKRMANRLTAEVAALYGPGCLADLTEHHRASSMSVVAEVLRATAELARAVVGRGDTKDGDSSPPAA